MEDTKPLILEDVKHLKSAYYSCANVVEKRYECNNINNLIWWDEGNYGRNINAWNYRFCKICYDKWNEDGQKVGFQNMKSNYQLQQGLSLGKCLIKLPKKF